METKVQLSALLQTGSIAWDCASVPHYKITIVFFPCFQGGRRDCEVKCIKDAEVPSLWMVTAFVSTPQARKNYCCYTFFCFVFLKLRNDVVC